uniref:Putative secreted protein n=1 Tax=Ixodes ricinus TaxID=34613 RepID=A0A6B0UC85_IXORI
MRGAWFMCPASVALRSGFSASSGPASSGSLGRLRRRFFRRLLFLLGFASSPPSSSSSSSSSSSFSMAVRLSASARLSTAMAKNTLSRM